jgi:hypothetical protein
MYIFWVLLGIAIIVFVALAIMGRSAENAASAVLLIIVIILLGITAAFEETTISGAYMANFVGQPRVFEDRVYKIVLDTPATNIRLDSLKMP